MAEMLDDRMRQSRSRSAVPSEDRDSTHVKTYLIEANLVEDTIASKASKAVREILSRLSLTVGNIEFTLSKGADLASVQTRAKRHAVTTYIDFSNPRFWLMHSMGDSDALDSLVSKWISALPELDRAWLPGPLLESCGKFGALRGISLSFDRRWAVASETSQSPVDKLQCTFYGKQSRHLLDVMRKPDAAPNEAALSRVSLRLDNGGGVNDVMFNGKVTGRGKSFDDHLAMVTLLFERYANQIRRVESRFAIRAKKSQRNVSIEGEPVGFQLSSPIKDLSAFCQRMFSGTEPFRLWGLPVRLGERFFTVSALDLHSGKTIAFEVMPDLIRAYLPAGSCGNSILRFYTNLQHGYDAQVTAISGTGEPVFEF